MQYIIIIRVVPIVKWVIETLRFLRFIRPKAFTAWKCFFVQTNCTTFWRNVKQRRQFIGKDATNFDAVTSRQIASLQGKTSTNFLLHRRILAQMKTKSRVTCRLHQIDAIADEMSQPWADGEAIPNHVGDTPFTWIRASAITQWLEWGNWYQLCYD